MNTVQWVGTIRMLAIFISGMGFAQAVIPKWVLDWLQDEAALTGLVTGVGFLVTAFYALWSRRKAALLQTVAELPDVRVVEVKSAALADKVPSGKVVAR